MSRRLWKRLANLRAARRRHTKLPPPAAEAVPPMPPLESPDDDREFLPTADPGARVEAEPA